jgi:hypothetical protein
MDCSRLVSRSRARDADDAVGGDVEGDLDLDLARSGGLAQAVEDELAQQLVLLGQARALALKDEDLDRGLVVLDGRKDVAAGGGDGGVLALDQHLEAAAIDADAEVVRGDVQQDQDVGAPRP